MCTKTLITLLCFMFLFSGCEVKNLNTKINSSQMTTSYIKQLIGVNYDDIEKIYGSPERSTYYINKSDLANINKNYINLRNLNYYSIIKSYYRIDNDNYMVLYYKNNKVINAFFDDSDIINKNDFFMDIENCDITLNYFKNSSSLNDKFINKNFKNNIHNNFENFRKTYNLSFPQIYINISNKNLYFYNIDNKNKDLSLFIITKSNKITFIDIIKTSQIWETVFKNI